jgi:predicted regulator of Ras-like GTPase activity (Roadblock/LC7/MglB family)
LWVRFMYKKSVHVLLLQKADYISKREIIEGILYDLKKTGMEASVISSDGLLICSTISGKQNVEVFASMCATMINAANIVSKELGANALQNKIIVKTTNGAIIGTGAGPNAILVVTVRQDKGFEMLFPDITQASDKIWHVLAR